MIDNLILDHISYAVRSTDDAISQFSLIYPIVSVYKSHDKRQNIYVTYLSNKYESHRIELIEAACKPSPVDNILKSENSVLYHTCYRSRNFKKSINEFLKHGYITITPPFVPVNEDEVYASHLYNENVGIVEIIGRVKKEMN